MIRVCLDAQTDRKLSVFGRHFGQGDCRRSVMRDAAGVYHFSSTCRIDSGATVKAMGTASGDFTSGYSVRSEVNVSGAPVETMNGMHQIEISARYLGACPAGTKPGEVNLGSGLKVSIDQLPQIAQALGPG